MKNWYDVYDILYDGNKKEIENIRCINCGGELEYNYLQDTKTFQIKCAKCGYFSRGHNGPIPNCAKYFGDSAILPIKK